MKQVLFILLGTSFLFSQNFEKYFPPNFILKTAPPLQAVLSPAVQHGLSTEKKIALTFDACANAYRSKFDSSVARILVAQKIPATIFISGKWALEHRKAMEMLAGDSLLEFGNHSFIHPHCTEISPERFEREIELTQNIIFTMTGKTPVVFRPPYGEYNDSMLAVLGRGGIRLVEFSLPSGDPDTNATKMKLVDYVGRKTRNGSIIVMHINKRGWHTAEALPEIINELKKKQFEFVTVSGLMNEKKK